MAQGRIFRADNAWAFRVDVGTDPATGKRRQKYKGGFRTKKLAEEACSEVQAKAKAPGGFHDPSKLTVAEYMEQWVVGVRPSLAINTADSYENTINNWIVPHIGAMRLAAVDPPTLQRLYAILTARGKKNGTGLSPRSVKLAHTVMNLALQQAVAWGMLPYNPAAQGIKRAKPDHKPMVVWGPEEALRFLERAEGEPKFYLWALMLGTGLRKSEALGMRWQDVDFEAGRLSVVQAYVTTKAGPIIKEPKTRTSKRVIEVELQIIKLLREQRQHQRLAQLASPTWVETGHIFTGRDGGRLDPQNVRRAFEAACKAAEVQRLTPHGLRHTFATLALDSGIHPKLVQEMLGHANISITMDLYTHSTPTMHREAAKIIAAKLFGKAV
jgi:integrase